MCWRLADEQLFPLWILVFVCYKEFRYKAFCVLLGGFSDGNSCNELFVVSFHNNKQWRSYKQGEKHTHTTVFLNQECAVLFDKDVLLLISECVHQRTRLKRCFLSFNEESALSWKAHREREREIDTLLYYFWPQCLSDVVIVISLRQWQRAEQPVWLWLCLSTGRSGSTTRFEFLEKDNRPSALGDKIKLACESEPE